MKRKVISIVLAAAMITACAACSKEAPADETVATTTAAQETEEQTEATEEESSDSSEEATEAETEAPAEETFAPRPAEIAFDDDAYTEFAEPVAYNVINDTVAYRDSALVTVNREIPTGGMVIGLGSDGNYIITDAQEFVPLADLEAME